jgi:hypothetical protein
MKLNNREENLAFLANRQTKRTWLKDRHGRITIHPFLGNHFLRFSEVKIPTDIA